MPDQRVVHFEIPADDPEGLTRFYGDLFGWKIDKAPSFDYWLCDTGAGDGINGAIMRRAQPQQIVTNYVQVQSVDGWAEKATALGANVVVHKQAVPGQGWFAHVIDPQGNPFGLWQDDSSAA